MRYIRCHVAFGVFCQFMIKTYFKVKMKSCSVFDLMLKPLNIYCIQHWPLAISLSYIAVQSIPLTAIRRSSICHRQNHFATGILPVCELKFGAWHNLGNFPFNGFCYFNSTACCPLTAIVFTLSYDMLRGMNVVFIDRVKWTEKEVPELHVYFNKQLVRFKDCEAARHRSKTEGGQLHRWHWETIKKKVNNMLQKT